MIKIRHKGSLSKTERFLKKASVLTIEDVLHKYGPVGVELLSRATPIDSGLTSRSWRYKVEKTNTSTYLRFYNDNVQDGWANVAILIQFGHGTGTGGYVQGIDYINPALRPMFNALADDIGKEVSKL